MPVKSLDFCYYKHVGIIGYNKKMLDFYASSSPGRLELIEGIDTLRFLDYGKELQLIPVDGIRTLSRGYGEGFGICEKGYERAAALKLPL